MGISMNNTRPDLHTGAIGSRRYTHGMRPDTLPRGRFVAEVLARGLGHLAHDAFRGACPPDALDRSGEPALVRRGPDANEVELYLRLHSGALAWIDAGHGQVRIEVAAATRAAAHDAAKRLRESLMIDEPPAERVSVAFWMRGECGGDVRHRDIHAEPFEAIANNYPLAVRSALDALTETSAPDRGRLILWRGEPGTGKSHALRALARAWAPWCSAHFIMDPDELLGRGGAYILDVLTWDAAADEDRWRLLILEDAGELVAADARAATGQALSRLLNVADGLLGQGTRTLILITTNEPVGRLHPAARRAGRCLSDIEFTPFRAEEANAWLAANGRTESVSGPTTLAELFGLVAGAPIAARGTADLGFGFGRALGDRPGRR